MTKWARIEDDKVVEITMIDPEGRFDESYNWVQVERQFDPYVNEDYVFADNKVVPPDVGYYRDQLFVDLAAFRWEKQSQGVMYRGLVFDTVPESLNTLNGVITLGREIESKPTFDDEGNELPPIKFTTPWKGKNGFAVLDVDGLVAGATVCGQHVQSVFAVEGITQMQIGAALGAGNYAAAYQVFEDSKLRIWSIAAEEDLGADVPEVTQPVEVPEEPEDEE